VDPTTGFRELIIGGRNVVQVDEAEQSDGVAGSKHVENRCKIFAWILVQDKILTAQNLQKRG